MKNSLPLRLITPNLPQLRGQIVGAPVTIDCWSRAAGKSYGHAFRLSRIAFEMPRSKNIIEGRTYQQVLTKTLPGVIDALEQMGYYQDIHFVLNQKPPKNWDRCHQRPGDYSNTMAWINGTLFQIISQDRAGDARGLNVDSITADEALTLDRTKLETGSIAANRGPLDRYDSDFYNSIHLSTSKGFGSEFKWVTDFGKYYEDEFGIYHQPVLNKIVALELKMVDSENHEERRELWREIRKLKKKLIWKKSSKGVYYNEADIFDNIGIVGWKYVRNMRRVMTDLMFLVEILNKSFDQVENGFYNINDGHLYEAINYLYLESLDYDILKIKTETNDCRKDADLKPDLPIDISLDYGAFICCLVSGQTYDKTDWTQNSFYVKRPELIQKLVNNFCNYYQYHKRKEVIYYYDHTALPADGKSGTNYFDEVCAVLTARGWKITPVYIGQAPHHHDKYMLSSFCLKGNDERFNRQQFNKTNCKYLLLSMQQAPLKQGKRGFEKDKSSEWRLLTTNNREEATDFSDAWDTMNWGKNITKIGNGPIFEPVTFAKGAN